MIGKDYWGKQWDETIVHKFDQEDPNKKDDFVTFSEVIQMALEDFDHSGHQRWGVLWFEVGH